MFPAASANTTIRAYNREENPSKTPLMLACAQRLARLDFPAVRHLEVSSVALTQARGMIAASQQQTKPAGKALNGSRNDALDGESVHTHLVDVHLSEHSW
tara:strand:+ start:5154 stop:5453 length:300 start_codon:yes stop_codon:yes gene_type:complete